MLQYVIIQQKKLWKQCGISHAFLESKVCEVRIGKRTAWPRPLLHPFFRRGIDRAGNSDSIERGKV